MVSLRPDGTYRGPGGPDPKKTRGQRAQELDAMARTKNGREIILALWMEAKGMPFGTCPPVGTSVRQEMIPDVLAHEYPEG